MTVNDHHASALAPAQSPNADVIPRRVDHAAVQRAARELLRAVGANADSDALEETPRRVADAYAELLTPQPFRATTFPNDDGYDQLIVARAIPSTRSACTICSRSTGWRTSHISPAIG